MRKLEVRERRSLRTEKGLRREGIQWGDLGRIIAGGREGLRASTRELWGNGFFISSYLCVPAKGKILLCQHARLYVLSSQSVTLRTLFVSRLEHWCCGGASLSSPPGSSSQESTYSHE